MQNLLRLQAVDAIVLTMSELANVSSNGELPSDLASCWAIIDAQRATIAMQAGQLETLTAEQDKLRELIQRLLNGHRSERRVLADPNQGWLPFENNAEFQEARAEAQAEAQAIVERYAAKQKLKPRKRRSEALPSHLHREEQIMPADAALSHCGVHGPRQLIGYDVTETLVYRRPELYVRVKKYPKYACAGEPACGVASPERPTSLVEGDRYDTSVAATIIEAKWFHHLPIYRQQDLFAGSGWAPSRSTLLNIVSQVAFVIAPLIELMTRLVQGDIGVGLDETSCRMLLPKETPRGDDQKSRRLAEKVAEARAAGHDSLLAKMWVYSGLHTAAYNIFDFRVSRHRDGPDDFFRHSQCKVQGDCFSGNRSVVLNSDGRLSFVACWGHARRKFVEATTYAPERDLLLGMIQALYDIETRAKDMSWQERQALRQCESTIILESIRRWLDSEPLGAVLPKSDFAEALRYLRNHWQALNAYVSDGRIPIDNNGVERLMKQVAMGRKAWLFVASMAGGEQSAQLMTLVSSARRHDLDVWGYIKDVLDQLLAGSTDYQSLLPDVWKQKHPEAVREYRVAERRDKAERKQVAAAKRRFARPKH
jgi:transposase